MIPYRLKKTMTNINTERNDKFSRSFNFIHVLHLRREKDPAGFSAESIKTESCHNDNIIVTYATVGFRYNNLWWH